MKFLIMAGGKGTRLWPVSRLQKPKQFQKLISEKTMLQETVDRLLPVFSLKDIFVSTNRIYAEEVRKELPELPAENIIGEPTFRERASCIALASAIFSKFSIDETVVVLPSDHFIKNKKKLINIISRSDSFLKNSPESLIAVGIKPVNAETGYGYIKRGKRKQQAGSISEKDKLEFFEAEKFVEKPDLLTAQKIYEDGNYFWNSSIYIWKNSAIIGRFEKFIPDSYLRLCRIKDAVGTEDLENVINREYPLMDMISIEYGILENDDRTVLVSDDLGWSDVGSWSVLKDSMVDAEENHFVRGEHLDVGSKNLLVYGSKKLITTIGLRDLIIVDADDVLLVCNKNDSQLVKSVVEKLEKDSKIKLL
ncbi:MAG: sugar phosphate nucleotidyltransferase [Minisyncoccia bacterium]